MLSDFKDAFNTFLQSNALWICLAIVGAIVIVAAVLIIVYAKTKKPAKSKEINAESYLIALGGKDNIKEVSRTGSRITVKLNDDSKLDKDKLHELGISSVLVMSEKFILVAKENAEKIYEQIK